MLHTLHCKVTQPAYLCCSWHVPLPYHTVPEVYYVQNNVNWLVCDLDDINLLDLNQTCDINFFANELWTIYFIFLLLLLREHHAAHTGAAQPWKHMPRSSQHAVFALMLMPEVVWISAVRVLMTFTSYAPQHLATSLCNIRGLQLSAVPECIHFTETTLKVDLWRGGNHFHKLTCCKGSTLSQSLAWILWVLWNDSFLGTDRIVLTFFVTL